MHEQMMADMKAGDAKLDALVKDMNAATGDAKVDAIAAVVNELVRQQKAMHEPHGTDASAHDGGARHDDAALATFYTRASSRSASAWLFFAKLHVSRCGDGWRCG